jgi:uncharacterized UPF0160 family protein
MHTHTPQIKMEKIVIATHNGTFHADEVTAYAILNYLFPNNELIRTRESEIIHKANIVIDVGQVYDQTNHRYDHHQSSFNQSIDNQSQITLSSAGLIYKHFGDQLLDKFCTENKIEKNEKAYNDIYYRLIAEIDAHDNGIRQYSDNFYEQIANGEIKQKFFMNLSFGQIISKLNTQDPSNDEEQDKAFKKAVSLAWDILSINIKHYFQSQTNFANDYVIMEQAMKNRFNDHISGKIVIVEQNCINWRKCLGIYEGEHPDEPKISFIVYKGNNSWNVRAISDQLFINRENLLPTEEMLKSVKVPDDIIFVHVKLFIAASKTIQTAIEMAIVSLKSHLVL